MRRFASFAVALTLLSNALPVLAQVQEDRPKTPSVEASGQISVGVPGQPGQPQPGQPQPAPQAAQPSYPPPGGVVSLYVRDDVPGLVHRVYGIRPGAPVKGDRVDVAYTFPVGSCVGNCTFQVQPGRYVLEVDESSETRKGRKVVEVYGPTVVDVSPGSKSQRSTGLVLGITGPVAFVVGTIGLVIVSVQRDLATQCGFTSTGTGTSTYRCTDTGDKPSYTPWVLLMVAGIGATTAGWIMFGTASTKMHPSSGMAPPQPTMAFGVVPTKDGAAAGLTVHF